jgi:hypothetical protein
MWDGVAKSGSPIDNDITSSMVAAISKKRLKPEGGRFFTRVATNERMRVVLSLS